MPTPFRVNVLDANDVVLGSGPLQDIISLNDTQKLDEMPTAVFTMPSGTKSILEVKAGRKFDLYDPRGKDNPQGDGYIGRFHYSSRKMGNTLTVKCIGEAIELTRATVGFRRTYNNVSVTSALNDLIGIVSGWSASAESAFNSTNTIMTLEGESPYRGIDELRDRFGHFRFVPGKVLEFGTFGDDSGFILKNALGQQGVRASTDGMIKDGTVTLMEEADDIFNTIIPLGAGQGEGVQLTIEAPIAGGAYAVESASNQDGTLYYYIQDAASVAMYGERVRIMNFPQIRPIDNSKNARRRAALALQLTAETFMGRHLAPKQTYSISEVIGLDPSVKVGQTVFIDYRGVVDGFGYMRLRGDFWVMEIKRTRSATGKRSTKLTISSTGAKRTADSDVIIGMQRDINAMGVHVASNPTIDRVGRNLIVKGGESSTSREKLFIPIGLETKSILSAILRIKTKVLVSPVESSGSESTTIAAGGGGTTPAGGASTTPSGGGSTTASGSVSSHSHSIADHTGATTETGGTQWAHTHPTPAHTHATPAHAHTLNDHTHAFTAEITTAFGKFSDTVYPEDVRIKINGTDQTTALGGPWGTASASVEAELVITDILNAASGGIQQRHEIEIYCDSSYGIVDTEAQMVLSIQAIAAY